MCHYDSLIFHFDALFQYIMHNNIINDDNYLAVCF